MVKPLGSPAEPAPRASRSSATRADMEARLKATPHDAASAVRLADALLRLARVTDNAGLAVNAERALTTVLAADVDRYDARRMLATVLLSQHRFRDAIREAERCQQMHPNDAWPLGVIGDAHLELGEYDRPSPPSSGWCRRGRTPPATPASLTRASCRAICPARCD